MTVDEGSIQFASWLRHILDTSCTGENELTGILTVSSQKSCIYNNTCHIRAGISKINCVVRVAASIGTMARLYLTVPISWIIWKCVSHVASDCQESHHPNPDDVWQGLGDLTSWMDGRTPQPFWMRNVNVSISLGWCWMWLQASCLVFLVKFSSSMLSDNSSDYVYHLIPPTWIVSPSSLRVSGGSSP